MSILTSWVRYGERGEYLGYEAKPERAALPLPAVIVLQEALGLDPHIEDVTRRIAAAGYVAFAPDLFCEDGERWPAFTRERLAELMEFMNALPPGALADTAVREKALADRPPDQATRLAEIIDQLFVSGTVLKLDRYLPQLHATAAHLRAAEASRGRKLAVIGFCMGGGLSGLFACHDPELAGAAIFYGMSPAAERVAGVRCPIIGFYGERDPRINGGVPAFAAAMKAAGQRIEVHTYVGAGHAFFNDSRNTYDAGATRDATARLLAFLRDHLSA
jgi:carboxymethylenebutenolidase